VYQWFSGCRREIHLISELDIYTSEYFKVVLIIVTVSLWVYFSFLKWIRDDKSSRLCSYSTGGAISKTEVCLVNGDWGILLYKIVVRKHTYLHEILINHAADISRITSNCNSSKRKCALCDTLKKNAYTKSCIHYNRLCICILNWEYVVGIRVRIDLYCPL
jgi:hypothetical protein